VQALNYAYCLIGWNLASLKLKGKKLIGVAQQHLPATQYGRSQIYLLMNLHELSTQFPKLAYVTLSIKR